MRMTPVMIHLLRYCLVGGTTAVVHIVVLLLGQWMSLSLANPIAFLAASVAGYLGHACLLYTSPSPRDGLLSRMPSSA